ncbi:MAG: hypothetical protein U9N60_00550 [Thermodesulfobacteriota bacterium]|nr:hypothetical protein [Thermodesulfobacteriota bacterium]
MFLAGIQFFFNKINGWIQDLSPSCSAKAAENIIYSYKLAKYVPDIKKISDYNWFGGGNGWHGQTCLSVYPVWLGDQAIS